MRNPLLLALLLAAFAAPAQAKDPIVVCDASGCASFGRDGIIDFAKEYEKNPRDLTLTILDHPFGFDVTGSGADVTSLRFTSAELGIDRTFNGANTAEVEDRMEEFFKSDDFLKPFMRLINSGAGGQLTSSPVSAVGMMVRSNFHEVMFSNLHTMEEKRGVPPGRDPSISGSFGQFNDRGYKGSSLSVTPGGTLDFGERRDRHLKLSLPLSQMSLEGLETYRVGLVTQYLHPFYLPRNTILTVGPGVSYIATGSMDLPNLSGLIGGAMSATLNKDWNRWIGTLGTYYGHFRNLGGIDTDIQANVGGWGLQTGYRVTERTIASLYLIGVHEKAGGFGASSYRTLGLAYSFRIAGKLGLTISANKSFGLVGRRFAELGMGSAWFF
ncbi:MAG: hypothetical protein HY554_00130 [Elusimicrobia bacterium]|nr:hypothetical protein [Elusimicrobiota bacterium]